MFELVNNAVNVTIDVCGGGWISIRYGTQHIRDGSFGDVSLVIEKGVIAVHDHWVV